MTDDATPRVGERAAEDAAKMCEKIEQETEETEHYDSAQDFIAALIQTYLDETAAAKAETATLSARLAETEEDRDDWKATAEAHESAGLQAALLRAAEKDHAATLARLAEAEAHEKAAWAEVKRLRDGLSNPVDHLLLCAGLDPDGSACTSCRIAVKRICETLAVNMRKVT